MRRCWMPLLKRKARPSASTRYTVAPTRRGEPSRGTTLRRTDVPILSPLVGSDFGTEGTDVERSRQEAARSGIDDDEPGDAGARVLPPLLLPGISMREEISQPHATRGMQVVAVRLCERNAGSVRFSRHKASRIRHRASSRGGFAHRVLDIGVMFAP